MSHLEVVVPVGQLVDAVLQGAHARHAEGDDEERGDRLVPARLGEREEVSRRRTARMPTPPHGPRDRKNKREKKRRRDSREFCCAGTQEGGQGAGSGGRRLVGRRGTHGMAGDDSQGLPAIAPDLSCRIYAPWLDLDI